VSIYIYIYINKKKINKKIATIGSRSISPICHIRDGSNFLPVLPPHRMRDLVSLFLSSSKLVSTNADQIKHRLKIRKKQ